jgi:hypothetical protein
MWAYIIAELCASEFLLDEIHHGERVIVGLRERLQYQWWFLVQRMIFRIPFMKCGWGHPSGE